MHQLSAVVITNNASATIGNCLDALLCVSEDVVVVDSGSTDGTREICLSKNVRYFQKEWGGYSANKNFGNDKAVHDYVLSIDSDEILSTELIAAIKRVFSEENLADAYKIRFITNFAGSWIRYGSWNPEWHIRIFNKQKIQWQLQDVHETLHILPSHIIQQLSGTVLHYSYATVEAHKNKIEAYTSLFAERAFKAGKTTQPLQPLISAAFTFFSGYFLKAGFLDGLPGLVVARNNALYSYLKYKKLALKWKRD